MIGLGSVSGSRWELADYLERDKNDPELSRAAFSYGINLLTDDPYEAAAEMHMCCDIRTRSVRPVYHIPVSFSTEDAP